MYSWGSNNESQLGFIPENKCKVFEPYKCDLSFLQPANGDNRNKLRSLSCGKSNSVFVLENGSVCNYGSSSNSLQIHNMKELNTVCCGERHSLGITTAFDAVSWGSNTHGQLGINEPQTGSENTSQLHNVHLLGLKVVQIACGSLHSLALVRSGVLYSWGCNSRGQLGLCSTIDKFYEPQHVMRLQGLPLHAISAGGLHSMVVTIGGNVFSWGCNKYGQLGIGYQQDEAIIPTKIKLASQSITNLSCGENHSAVWSAHTGEVFTFGRNNEYQLGHPDNKNLNTPQQPSFLKNYFVSNVACGELHTVFLVKISDLHYLYGSGSNKHGQLGTSKTQDCSYLSKCSLDDCDFGFIACGGNHVICVQSNSCELVNPSYFEISRLNEEHVNSLLQLNPTSSVPTNLSNLLTEVFSSPSCINASFLSADGNLTGCSKDDSCLNYELIAKFWELRNEEILKIIWEAFTTKVLPTIEEQCSDYECLRLYIILVHLPQFMNYANLEYIFAPFCRAMLSVLKGKDINKWLASMPSEFLQSLLNVFRNAAAFILEKEQFLGDIWRMRLNAILQIMQFIHSFNQAFGEQLSLEEFYIPNINTCFANEVMQNPLKTELIERQHRDMCAHFTFIFNVSDKRFVLSLLSDHSVYSALDHDSENPKFFVEIDRRNVVRSFLDCYHNASEEDLAKRLYVKFKGDVVKDGGGPSREFLTLARDELLDVDDGIFKWKEDSEVSWFAKRKENACLDKFECAGVLCGLAIFNGFNIDFQLPTVAYKKLLNQSVTLDDLSDVAPKVAKELNGILNYDGDDFEDVYQLTFQIEVENETVNLYENGNKLAVTQENKKIYVDKYTDYLLNKRIEKEFNSFRDGFFAICKEDIFKNFHASELQQLISGYAVDNFSEYESSTEYKDEYNEDHPTIRFFWEAVENFNAKQTKALLRFLTGSDRKPDQNFLHKFTILPRKLESVSETQSLLPVASTCQYQLKLPVYSTYEKLTKKLTMAITHIQGFGLP